jgi:hypothetical protein
MGETTDDPYELRLDARAARNGWYSDPNSAGFMPVYDNVFSPADLEALLRPYDIDSMKLPLRLAGMLGSLADEARLRMTTDSWDTTMISGSAAEALTSWLVAAGTAASSTSALNGIIGGEAARGERFDLNRPLTSTQPTGYAPANSHPYYVQRQAYFKDLFTLAVALSGTQSPPAEQLAQWAANVVEFRDADSTITPFEYDTTPQDGWDIDNDATTTGDQDRGLVWGAERPEALITETSAWEDDKTGELFIMIHRPWNALAFSTGTSIAAEPIDVDLDYLDNGMPSNFLDLGRKSGTNPASADAAICPVWRLRIVAGGSSAIVRLDAAGTGGSAAGGAAVFNAMAVNDAASTPKLAPDSWLCIRGNNSLPSSITNSGTVTIDGDGPFRVPGPLPAESGTPPRDAMVYLERLSDPRTLVKGTSPAWTQPASAVSVPMYRVVDQAPIKVVNRMKDPVTKQIPPTGIASKLSRDASTLWKVLPATAVPTPAASIAAGPALGPLSATPPNRPRWFPWLNRPFVSATELLLVPRRNALDMLVDYQVPSTAQNDLPSPFVLDAVHVPTRFAGIHRTVTAASGTAAIATNARIHPETTPVNQLSAYREPGRVNLNTVTSDDVWNAVVAGPLVQTGTSTPDPVRARSAANFAADPAKTTAALLSLSGAGTLIVTDTNAAIASGTAFNPAHSIYTATRLANTATIRSNVFAVWITLRESVAGDPDSVRYHRGFYIVDRSIPVAHEPGKDHNVWDAVILRRIVE